MITFGLAVGLFLVLGFIAKFVCFLRMPPILPVVVALLLAGTADACPRCGLFGRKCKMQSQHVVAQDYVAYQAPPAVATNASTNFVFNNTFPTPYLLSGQGSSVYGYSLASQSYQLDANLFMDRASRFTELSLQSSAEANRAFTENTAAAMALNDAADRRTKNTLLAMSAIQANSAPAGASVSKSLSFQATVSSDGKLSVRQIDGAQSGTVQTQRPTTEAAAVILCGKCHDGSGAGGVPAALILDGRQQITAVQYDACIAKMRSGEMPPPNKMPPLSAAEAVSITAMLCSLKEGPIAAPPPQPVAY